MEAVQSSIELVFGPKWLEQVQDDLRMASSATLSRATYKLDVWQMLMRRQQWDTWCCENKTHSVQLCLPALFDSACFHYDPSLNEFLSFILPYWAAG